MINIKDNMREREPLVMVVIEKKIYEESEREYCNLSSLF